MPRHGSNAGDHTPLRLDAAGKAAAQAFWLRLIRTPADAFRHDMQAEVQERLRETTELLRSIHAQCPDFGNTADAWPEALQFSQLVANGTAAVNNLVLMSGSGVRDVGSDSGERRGCALHVSGATVAAVAALMEAAATASPLAVRNCCRWLQPTLFDGGPDGARLAEGTALVPALMEALKQTSCLERPQGYAEAVIGALAELVTASGALAQQAQAHPNHLLLLGMAQCALGDESMFSGRRPSARVAQLAMAVGETLVLRSESLFGTDFDALEALYQAATAQIPGFGAMLSVPRNPAAKLTMVERLLQSGRSGLTKKLQRTQQILRSLAARTDINFTIEQTSSESSLGHAQAVMAELAPSWPGHKDNCMDRKYLESDCMRGFAKDAYVAEVYGRWSCKHVYEQLAGSRADLKAEREALAPWERDLASCLLFGPANVVLSLRRKLPSCDVRPWVEAFVGLALPLTAGGGEVKASLMAADRRLMRLFVFAEMAQRAGQASVGEGGAAAGQEAAAGGAGPGAEAEAGAGFGAQEGAEEAGASFAPGGSSTFCVTGVASPAPMPAAAGPPVCDACGAPAAPGKRLLYCSACQTVRYCSRECQKRGWRAGHKARCKLMTEKGGVLTAVMERMQLAGP